LPVGGSGAVVARVTNQSERVWPAGCLVKLANHWYRDASVVTWDDGRADLPHDVAPGESVELTVTVNAPSAAGEYRLELDMVREFVAWWAESGTQPVSSEIRVHEAPVATRAQHETHATAVTGGIEMHGMPIELVTALLTHCGHDVLAAVPDTLSGTEWESFTYLVWIGS
jgi:hypothetical protein